MKTLLNEKYIRFNCIYFEIAERLDAFYIKKTVLQECDTVF